MIITIIVNLIKSATSIFLFIIFMLFSCYSIGANQNCDPLIGVIIPMKEESSYLKQHIEDKKEIILSGIHYIRGRLAGHSIVFAQTGVGKINAAIVATRLIQDFRPDLILMSGSAGSLNTTLRIGDVIIGKQVLNADLGRLTNEGPEIKSDLLLNPNINRLIPEVFTIKPHVLNFLINMNYHTDVFRVKFGSIATSDILPNDSIQVEKLKKNHVDVVEMEGASLMQACYIFDVTCVVIRSVSNPVQQLKAYKTQEAGQQAAKILIKIIENYKMCTL